MSRADDDLAEAIRELTETLRELQGEFQAQSRRRERRRPRVPLRPPTPRELLRFADDVAIPTLIAILEANVRALEAFQRSLRLARTADDARERTRGASDTTRERAEELRATTLDQLDGALGALQRAVSEGALPENERARELLENARELRADVDARLAETAESSGSDEESVKTIELEEPDDEPETSVDVDAELETLRDQYGPGESDEPPNDDDEDRQDAGDGDGSDADDGSDNADGSDDSSGGR